MRQQTTGLVLCALLMSTFGHELLSRHKAHHEGTKGHRALARENEGGNCHWVCDTTAPPTVTEPTKTDSTPPPPTTPGPTDPPPTKPGPTRITRTPPGPTDPPPTKPGPTGITRTPPGPTDATGKPAVTLGPITVPPPGESTTLLINSTTNLVGILNLDAHFAIIFDVKANLVASFNLTSNKVIIYNYESNVGYSLSINVSIGSTAAFQAYFASLTSLQIVYQQSQQGGEKFTSESVSVQISLQLQIIVSYLGQVVTREQAVAVFVKLSIAYAGVFKAAFGGFLRLVGTGVIRIRVSIVALVAVFQGINQFFSDFNIQISVLIQKRIRLSLEALVNARSSLEVFVYLYTSLSSALGAEFTNAVRGYFENSVKFFGLLVALGGYSLQGSNGVVTVILRILIVIQNKASASLTITEVIDILIEYYRVNNGRFIALKEFRAELQVLLDFIINLRLQGSLQVVATIQAIIQGNLSVGGVNISAIISILTEVRASIFIQAIVRIFVVLRSIVAIEISIGALFYRITLLLAESGGYEVVVVILGVRGESALLGSGNVLARLLQNQRIANRLGIFAFLLQIRIFGQIVAAINAGLTAGGIRLGVAALVLQSGFATYLNRVYVLIVAISRGEFAARGISGGVISTGVTITVGAQVTVGGSGSSGGGGSGSVGGGGSGSIGGGGSGSVEGGGSGSIGGGGSGSVGGGGSGSIGGSGFGSIGGGVSGSIGGGGSGSFGGGVSGSSGGGGSASFEGGGSGSFEGGASGSFQGDFSSRTNNKEPKERHQGHEHRKHHASHEEHVDRENHHSFHEKHHLVHEKHQHAHQEEEKHGHAKHQHHGHARHLHEKEVNAKV